jgi:hypothetical protein
VPAPLDSDSARVFPDPDWSITRAPRPDFKLDPGLDAPWPGSQQPDTVTPTVAPSRLSEIERDRDCGTLARPQQSDHHDRPGLGCRRAAAAAALASLLDGSSSHGSRACQPEPAAAIACARGSGSAPRPGLRPPAGRRHCHGPQPEAASARPGAYRDWQATVTSDSSPSLRLRLPLGAPA